MRLAERAAGRQFHKNRCRRLRLVAHEDGLFGQREVNARGFNRCDFRDATREFAFLALLQAGLLDRAAGAERHVVEQRITLGRSLRQPLPGEQHPRLVIVAGGHLHAAGHVIDARRDPRCLQRLDDSGLVRLGKPRKQRPHLWRARKDIGHGNRGDRQRADHHRQAAADGGLRKHRLQLRLETIDPRTERCGGRRRGYGWR